ncbi:hypothetical protein ACN1NW_000480 [Acinetobacter baumannii]|nr:hypothetical protein [Acinetobacter baumannii]ELA7031062.1 hypothetical protein [Acinetobacter baumannii]ELA7118825.1 hypothetical protein [Acinetobacter baumannii]ELB0919775.1 hypothetical protein [Acinetobacter baumannii]ELB0965952.1 hypothetical protein [Acinetobacter baumannii]
MLNEQLEPDLNVVEHLFRQGDYVYRLMFLSNSNGSKMAFLKGLYDWQNPHAPPMETTLLTSENMDGEDVFANGTTFIEEVKRDLAGKAEYDWWASPIYFADNSEMCMLETKLTRTVGFYYKNAVLKFFRDQPVPQRNNPNWGAWA